MRVDSWRNIFFPTTLEAVSYCLLGIGVVVATNVSYIITFLTREAPIDSARLQLSLQDQLSGIAANRFVSMATIVVFWSIVGLAVYTLFWIGLNFVTGVKNEVVIETDYVNKASLKSRVKLPLIRFALATVALSFLLVSLKIGFPLWVDLARVFFAHLTSIDSQTILVLIVALLGSSLNIYLFFRLLHLIFAVRD